ncbi:MAG TPA: ATP-binding protein [Candidatus Faecalibacterium gallistercoris]|uniref:ATP-binding protein n=1 Tax=Candidatus Faecalibacterium gallistercoris TaxID=2838579 RepID=A0A9D2FHG9_9FIRM|nr:ATP-binding protein [Candidatus Faecalibacterium gallistercoris]
MCAASGRQERSVDKVRKKLPIGIDGFEKLRTNDFYYVDKTGFIADLLRDWGEVNLFTRPRRFGKTLNMSMLKCFFEIGTDKSLFDGLKIAENKELCAEYQGQFPVIFISLKSVDGLTFASAVAALRTLIGNEASRFQFLRDSDKLSDEEKALYRQLVQTGTAQGGIYAMTDEALSASLNTLSQLLAKHYGRKVVILIDEYDVPLDKAFQGGYYDEMVSLIRNLFGNALKTNDSLQFAVLTGCLRISKESIFTGLNNLNVMTVSDPYFCDSFGFTDDDVKELLDYYGLGAYHDAMRDWYDGYQFGNVSIYCPWDVIKYAQILLRDPEAEPENYWANTSGNGIIRRLLQKADQTTRDEVEQLINGETIVKTVRQELTYRDIEDSIDNIWSVLYSTGYLTSKGRLPGKQMKLALPNREVRELFIDLVKDWFREETRADTSRINRFCAAFPKGDVATIQDMLHDYLWDSISVRDTAVRSNMKENFYHGMLLGLLQSQGSWIVRSNAETGIGYSDISVATPERLGMVIELKYAEDGNLEAACAKALAQIDEKKYDEGLRRRGMKTILKYGIAFWEKECMVVLGVTDQ